MSTTRRRFLQSASVAAAPAFAANDKVQVGVIGCGARSQELMAALLTHTGVVITRVADAYSGRIERAIDRCGGTPKPARDYREILADKSVDAVVICTPDHWHKTMVVDAVNAGKDVYCDKPLTFRASEGPEIIAAARANKRIVQVGSQGCSSAIQQKAKEIIRSGKLGQITLIRAAYNRNTASGAWIYPIPPDASPQTVNWDMFQGPAKKHPFSLERFFRWRCYQEYSGGIATDLFVHLCTTIHYLMDAKAPSKAEGSFQFLGTEGGITLGWNGLTFHPETAREDNRWIVESWPKRLEEQYWKDPKVRESELAGTRPPRALPGEQHFTADAPDPTILHFGHWLNSLRTRQGHWEDAVAGHRAAACAHMLNQSAATGRLVEWDFARDLIKT